MAMHSGVKVILLALFGYHTRALSLDTAACSSTSGSSDATSTCQQEALVDDLGPGLPLGDELTDEFSTLALAASRDTRRRRGEFCKNEGQICAPDIATQLANAKVDPNSNNGYTTMNWLSVSSYGLALAHQLLDFFAEADPDPDSKFALSALGLMTDLGSATTGIAGSSSQTCDSTCLFKEIAFVEKEFVEEEIEEAHYNQLMDQINGARGVLQSQVMGRVGKYRPSACTWSHNPKKTSKAKKTTGAYKSLTGLGRNSAETLCLILKSPACKAISCEQTRDGHHLCSVFDDDALEDGFSNETAYVPSVECFNELDFGKANVQDRREAIEQIQILLVDMEKDLKGIFQDDGFDRPGPDMPQAALYFTLYASTYLSLAAHMVQRPGTSLHTKSSQDILVGNIDDFTTWARNSIERAKKRRLDYIQDPTKPSETPPFPPGSSFTSEDRFMNTCWDVSVFFMSYYCPGMGPCISTVINGNAAEDTKECSYKHHKWVREQYDQWWQLSLDMISQWQDIKAKVESWHISPKFRSWAQPCESA